MTGITLGEGEVLGPVVQLPGATGRNKPMRQSVMKVEADGSVVFERDVYFVRCEGVFVLECTVHSVVFEAERINAQELTLEISNAPEDSPDLPTEESESIQPRSLGGLMERILDLAPKPPNNPSSSTVKPSNLKP